INIKSRIDSQIMAVHFTEGQEVHKGDLLFSLDSGPPEAALRAAEANLARDRAQLDRYRLDLQRYQELLKRDNVARQQYDTAVA
ncbi:biotin/lipoyl-binding protein, partial [Acinetobacter baumannii]